MLQTKILNVLLQRKTTKKKMEKLREKVLMKNEKI